MAHYSFLLFFLFDIAPLPFSFGVSVWVFFYLRVVAHAERGREHYSQEDSSHYQPEWLFLQLHQWLSIHSSCTDMDCIICWHAWHFSCHKVGGVCICLCQSHWKKQQLIYKYILLFFLFLYLFFIFLLLFILSFILNFFVRFVQEKKLLGKKNKLNSCNMSLNSAF